MSDYQRGVLALRMKPIIEARAKTAMLEGKNQHSSPSPISDEATFNIFTGEVTVATPPVEPAPPIRTDEAVANLARACEVNMGFTT